jgi:peptidoglycan hydrolase-like protein with peptidoglycan-binding domain
MNPVAIIGIGGLALLLLAGKSNAATPNGTPAAVLERMKSALASGNATTIRATAAALRAEGYITQAADLERAATQLEAIPSSPTTGGVLKRGSTGADVRSWQTFLRGHGYAQVEIDGVFGVQTEDATKAFQRTKALTPDGIVGPDTLRAAQTPVPSVVSTSPPPAKPPTPTLPPTPVAAPKYMQRGSTGLEVAKWQGFLHGQGYSIVAIDGVFGVQTEDSTKAFQRSKALTPDGIVGPDTLKASLSSPPKAPVPAPVVVTSAGIAATGTPPTTIKLTVPTPTVVAAPAPAALPTAARLLQKGTSGSDVLSWQNYLRGQGYTSIAADGVFGVQTDDATKAFQRSRGLTADGIVGPATLRAATVAAPSSAATAAAGVAAAAAAAAGAAPRVLKRGLSGPDVVAWQTFLRSRGYTTVALDGAFGVATEDATKAFQKSAGLTADGSVGPNTLAAAAKPAAAAVAAVVTTITASAWRVLKRGASGADVKEWQTVLKLAGYAVTPDGVFGAETETATKAWQAARKLVADGIVGSGAVAALRAAPPVNVRVAGDFATASPLPGIIPDAAPPLVDVSADQSLAAQLALHLHTSIPGSEDRDLVEQFQRALGLNPTGAYGPGTARALMRYGLLPPKPFYWPSQQSQREKANYRQALLREAARDPVRAREWTAAAGRV